MGEVVNLRMARKRKARAEREQAAQRNRETHGLSRAERTIAEALKQRSARELDGHRREPAPDPADGDA